VFEAAAELKSAVSSTGVSCALARRRVGLDAARFIGSLGIVWTHSCADIRYDTPSALGRFAVPFFSMVAGVFLVSAMRGPRGSRPGEYLAHRAVRLGIPFVAWSAIYYIAHKIAQHTVGTNKPTIVGWWTALTGTDYHLWFLTYLLFGTIICVPIVLWALAAAPRTLLVAGTLIGLGIALVAFPLNVDDPGIGDHLYYLDRISARSSSLLWGIAFGLLLPGLNRRRFGALSTMLALAVFMICLGYYWINGRTAWAANIAGCAWFCVGLGIDKLRIARIIGPFARYSFGIYLIHPLFVALYIRLVAHLPLGHVLRMDIPSFVFVAGASIAVVATLQRIRWAAPIVPV
jgi:surface polysaccharide O-acyltransferase-like enzyme